MNDPIFRTYVTGLSHHSYAHFASAIRVSDHLVLTRDKGNRHDDNAIKVLTPDGVSQIGWVPQQHEHNHGQAVLAKLMDAGVQLECRVVSHDLSVGNLQKRLYVAIYVATTVGPEIEIGAEIHRLLQEARKEGMAAGKAIHQVASLGRGLDVEGFIVPETVVNTIKAMGIKEKEASIANVAYNKGFNAGDDNGFQRGSHAHRNEVGAILLAALDGTLNLYDALGSITGIHRDEIKTRFLKMWYKDGSPEPMVVRSVSPKFFATVSTLTLELRSKAKGTASSPVIPNLEVKPGDEVVITIKRRS